MQRGDEKGRFDLIKSFYSQATKGFINVGDIGDAVAGLMLLFTWDRANDKLQPEDSGSAQFQSPISLGLSCHPRLFHKSKNACEETKTSPKFGEDTFSSTT